MKKTDGIKLDGIKLDYFQRFSDAVELLVGVTPTEKIVKNWVLNEWEDGCMDLQSWVLQYGTQPFWWNQGHTILEAAHCIADTPIEGEEYHETLDYTKHSEIVEEYNFKKRVEEEKFLSTCSKEDLLEELSKRL